MSEVSREAFEALVERVEELEQQRAEDRRELERREQRIAELEAEVADLREAQADSVDQETVENLRSALDVSVQRCQDLEDEVDDLADDVDDIDEELDRQDNLLELTVEKRKDLRERVHELAREVEEGTDAEGQTPHYIRPETPLEDLVQLPQEIAEQNLTANQQRMKFVAEGVHEYTTKVPAGRALPWSDLRRVMAAGEGGQAYSMSVSRVMDFFEEFGKEDVEVVDRQDGQKAVVFDDDLVKRIVAYHNQTAQSNSVVSRNEVYG